jgi:hypothetical protein
MELIDAMNSGAKTLLAHFHILNKGNIPFQPDFDWMASNRKIAEFSEEDWNFMREYVEMVTSNGTFKIPSFGCSIRTRLD